jgi:catechol 2,3-dioxygenase-like lactoylglutathione lyase family enzyme
MSISMVLSVVPVANFETSIEWYERLLGRAPDAQPMPGLADWHLTDTAWVQVYRDRDRAGETALNFAVDDLRTHTTTNKNAKLASVTDPAGNTITFIENPTR